MCSMMLFHPDRKPFISQLSTISVLVFNLILTHFCRGQTQLIGSSQPIVAILGEDIILPCHLEPAKDVAGLTLEWTRPDLNPRFVYVWRSGQELVSKKHKSFEGRTSLVIDELKNGNISLKLSSVKLSDHGTYRCFIPALENESFVQLVIASVAVSSPVITLAGIDKTTSGVVLQCESKGWYPEPEVLWLDGEGNLLSVGPTETVRGPDDLYTVSSRVTVEKRHSNNITCRVQQNNINQSRETQIHVPDDFFNVQCSCSAITVGLAASLAVCIVLILLLFLILWKMQNIIKSKKWDETDKAEKKNCSKIKKTKVESYTEEEREREHLLTHETVQTKGFNGLKEELDIKKIEVEKKQAELQQLKQENQNNMDDLQTLKNKLENKNRELEKVRSMSWFSRIFWGPSKEEKRKAENEVETLKLEMETKKKETEDKTKEFEDKQVEVHQLQDEIQTMETEVQIETFPVKVSSVGGTVDRNECSVPATGSGHEHSAREES